MRAKAHKGFVAGGKVYGYRNVEVRSGDMRSHVILEIDPKQAAIVIRIFEMAAQGKGLVRIAKTLNGEGIPSLVGVGGPLRRFEPCCTANAIAGRPSTARPSEWTGTARQARR
jgi:hypothetical protein